MNVSDSSRKFIVIGFSLFVILGMITASVMGKKQDKAFQINDAEYSKVVQLVQEKKYAEVLQASEMLKSHQNSSEQVNYLIAFAAANTGEAETSLRHMERTLDLNPYRVEDSLFMLQYADILIMAGKKEEAMLVLDRCATLPDPENYPNYQEQVVQLQQQLTAQ